MDTSIFITDTNIIQSDSDSSTSSASTADELIQTVQLNANSNYKNILIDQFVKPIKSHGFFDREQNKVIEDGFELALLRLSHIFFSSNGVMNFTRLTKWMDMNKLESQELEEFFLDNPGVMDDSDFYSSEAGISIRKAWYNFLSNRNFFTYIHSTHQIVPDISNWFAWINNFFPAINFSNGQNEQDKLNIIYSALSWTDTNFQVIYSSFKKTNNEIEQYGFIQNIIVNGIELFLFESTNIKKQTNINQIYWTKTELSYS